MENGKVPARASKPGKKSAAADSDAPVLEPAPAGSARPMNENRADEMRASKLISQSVLQHCERKGRSSPAVCRLSVVPCEGQKANLSKISVALGQA